MCLLVRCLAISYLARSVAEVVGMVINAGASGFTLQIPHMLACLALRHAFNLQVPHMLVICAPRLKL